MLKRSTIIVYITSNIIFGCYSPKVLHYSSDKDAKNFIYAA